VRILTPVLAGRQPMTAFRFDRIIPATTLPDQLALLTGAACNFASGCSTFAIVNNNAQSPVESIVQRHPGFRGCKRRPFIVASFYGVLLARDFMNSLG